MKFHAYATAIALGALGLGCAATSPPPPDYAHGPEYAEAPELAIGSEAHFPAAWEGEALGIDELFALADANSPRIAAARAAREAAAGELREAGLYPNPSLDAAGREIPLGSGSSSDAAAYAGISQPLIAGTRRHRAIDAARARLKAADHALEDVRCAVLAEVYRAYVDVLTYQALTELNRALLDEADALVAAAKTPLDERRARIQADERALEVVRTAAEAVYAADRLERYLGGVRPSPDQVRGELVEGIVPEALDVGELDAVARHPEVLMLEATARAESEEVRRLRAELTPDVTVRLGGSYSGERDEGFAEAGVSVPIPIWDRNQGVIRAAQAREREALANVRAARDRLRSDFRIAIQQINEWDTLAFDYGMTIVPAAESSYRALLEAYTAGDATMTDVLDGQRDWFRTANLRVEYLARLNQTYVDLWRLRGGEAAAFAREE